MQSIKPLKPLRSYFNPRPPCGGRRRQRSGIICKWLFQSTPPVRGATLTYRTLREELREISIHAPRAGGDAERALLLVCV